GVAIDALDDMARLFEGIPLDRVSTSMTINATAIILLALYAAVARRQDVPIRTLAGTVQNDILKEYVARGTYIFPPRASLRIVTDIFAFCEREMPNWNTISISGYHIREAGSTAVQEVAFTFANAIAYVQAALEAGLDIDQVGQRLSFFFNAHNDFLEEIAKFRAARRLWARIMRDRFHATNPRAAQLAVDTGQAVVVGVNRFVGSDATGRTTVPILRIDPEGERRQIERVHAVRASRSAEACRLALETVSRAARDGTNLVPPLIAAV